ncbi:hypothetical protein BSY15_1909 [Acidovorax sp. RAC01]|nr:hypothetical protein BSY15_1909 [Acidovorax sp. RAC01]
MQPERQLCPFGLRLSKPEHYPRPFGLRLTKPEHCSNPFGLSLSKPVWRWLPRACVQGGGRESPGVRVPFFRVAERKEPKKGRPHCLRPLRFAPGQPVVLAGGVRRRTRCAALQLRSNSCGESVHDARVSFGTRATPPAALLGAYRGDWGEDIPSGHCFARPRQGSASAARRALRVERSDDPCGCSAVRLFGPPTPSGCACAGAVAGWHARRSARAS